MKAGLVADTCVASSDEEGLANEGGQGGGLGHRGSLGSVFG